jgi:hypothetical protein
LRKVLVNKQENQWQLKILFPGIKLAVGGVPSYGKVVYADFPMVFPGGTELVLEQSLAGFNLDSHLGLLGFLRECGYMSPAKLDRFEAAGRPGELDSKGREVVREGVFYRNAAVLDMYTFCSTLRVSNRVFLEVEEDEGYVLDILEAPLYRRLAEADRAGNGRLVEKVLRFLDSFYSKDVKFRARGRGRTGGFERAERVLSLFNRKAFKDFNFSGNEIEDSYIFFSLFGEAV